jgi:hypothetical protein
MRRHLATFGTSAQGGRSRKRCNFRAKESAGN